MAVARISLVGGSGVLDGVTIMDDYIQNTESVADYVTRYSGIKPGDLDPSTTTKHLVTLKVRLRLSTFVAASVSLSLKL